MPKMNGNRIEWIFSDVCIGLCNYENSVWLSNWYNDDGIKLCWVFLFYAWLLNNNSFKHLVPFTTMVKTICDFKTTFVRFEFH